MDRRRQKTRSAIFEAFGRLLASKGYSRITVQEIIDEANIGRTTFYAHFETKDSLLEAMCADLFEHVFSGSLKAEHTHDFSLEAGNAGAMVTHILHHLRDNRKHLAGILSGESGEPFLRFFREHLHELTATYILNGAERGDKRVPLDFLTHHIACAFVGMVQWWFGNDLNPSPEELAGYFMALLAPGAEQAARAPAPAPLPKRGHLV